MSPEQLSRYSDSLQAAPSGDRIPMEASYFEPVQTGPEAHQSSCTMKTGSFQGVKWPQRFVHHRLLSR